MWHNMSKDWSGGAKGGPFIQLREKYPHKQEISVNLGQMGIFELICAQKHPEFIDECIELLNSEWPRSKTARLVSIQQGSSDGFPTTLLLIDKSSSSSCLEGGRIVVAHCKVSPVSVYHPDACFVESVVVSKDLRGKGIGRIIMDKMENYVKCRGIRRIFLTTHDQQGFYEKLGYSFCDPVVIYGGKFGSAFGASKPNLNPALNSHQAKTVTHEEQTEANFLSQSMKKISLKESGDDDNANKVPLPPPPPPPLPLSKTSTKKLTKNDIVLTPNLIKVTMKKELF